jgi:hypothetical protein
MTKLLSTEVMTEVKTNLEVYLKTKYPQYANKISIHLDQKLDLVEVSKGMFTLSNEDLQRLSGQNKEKVIDPVFADT